MSSNNDQFQLSKIDYLSARSHTIVVSSCEAENREYRVQRGE